MALIATLGVTIFVGIPAILIGDDTVTTKVTGTAISSILQAIAFVGVPLLILGLMVGVPRRGDLGLRLPARWGRMIGLIVAVFLLYLVLSSGLGQLIGIGEQKDDLPAKLGAKDSAIAGIVIALCVTVLAPIGEEILLRGVIYPGLRNSLRRISPGWLAIGGAALIDGLIFGALHAGGSKAIFLPILALFGALLCLLYQFSGSLYAPILLHATNNTVAIATALKWSFLDGLLLWISAVMLLSLLALAARGFEARWTSPPAWGAPPAGGSAVG